VWLFGQQAVAVDHCGRDVDELPVRRVRVLTKKLKSRRLTETDECDVRPFSCSQGSDLLDADLACNHLLPESGDDRGDQGQAILAFVRDQYAHVVSLTVAQPRFFGRVSRRRAGTNSAPRRCWQAGARVESSGPRPRRTFFSGSDTWPAWRVTYRRAQDAKSRSRLCLFYPNRSSGFSPCVDERRRDE
jgi:hypothetical protein